MGVQVGKHRYVFETGAQESQELTKHGSRQCPSPFFTETWAPGGSPGEPKIDKKTLKMISQTRLFWKLAPGLDFYRFVTENWYQKQIKIKWKCWREGHEEEVSHQSLEVQKTM